MSLFCEATHGFGHPIHKEGLGRFLRAVTIGSRDQFFGLRDGNRGEEGGQDWFQGAAEPDVEEVGEVSVTDIIVVGRIC